MHMKTNSIQFGLGWLVGISFLFITACKNTPETMDEEIFIPVKDSRLYVRLIGNPDKPLLLNLHGGPGAFSGFDHEFNRKHLESDYLVAYLDQRGGGKSDEILDSTTLTMEQFVEDIDGVVDALKKRFADKKINLIGSSWGGTLGLMYMTDHQDKINSFICVSGKADGIYPIKAIIAHERKLAREQLSETKDTATQKKLEKILAKLDEIDSSELDQFFEDMKLLKHSYPEELGFNAYWATKKAQAKAAELGKDSAYYARANYTKSEFDQAMKKYEFVNRVFRNTYAYNHLNILD